MLYPQTNQHRLVLNLDGFWKFRKDELETGEAAGWCHGIPADRELGVPASWNEQDHELMNFWGTGWYERNFEIPEAMWGKKILLRFGSVNYLTTVWVNGVRVGEHEGAHLPFEFDITPCVQRPGVNRLVVKVDAAIRSDRLPPGDVEDEMIVGFKGQYPNNYYDFFPYAGIQRSVVICGVPTSGITDLSVNTEIRGGIGIIHYFVRLDRKGIGQVTLQLQDTCMNAVHMIQNEDQVEGVLEVENARFWCPEDPFLYELNVQVLYEDGSSDRYTQTVGIRTVEFRGMELLINGKPTFLTGVGMHEDFPVLGKGKNEAVMIKDINLLRWLGGNSLRTSHYPYSEEFLHYADRKGILVIGETPFVGFVKSHYTDQGIIAKSKRVTGEMLARDKNHPCIIAWSLANEPDTFVPEAEPFFKDLIAHAKELDPSRPVTVVNCKETDGDYVLNLTDFISLNRYYGWYEQAGQLDEGCKVLSEKLDQCYAQFGKPVMVTEFGADAIAGVHTDPPEQFTEEYQAEMITRQYAIIRSKPYTIGAHVWVLSDFKTSQTPSRVVVNRKGLFTRERQPKLAAHRVKQLWHLFDSD
jgi:beta-glucuronidase